VWTSGDERRKRTQPNQGIQRSALNGALLGVSFITLYTSVGIWIFDSGPLVYLPLLFTIPFLEFGGGAYVQHYALRYALARQKDIPFHYVRFLNDMAEQRILQDDNWAIYRPTKLYLTVYINFIN
jgi:hypothetical protein